MRSQGTVLPAVASTATPEASQVVRSSPRRVRPARGGRGGRPVQRPGLEVVAERGADHRQLHGDVHDQRPDRDPADGVVGGPEAERPRVPLRGVEQPGGELEDRRRDQHRDAQPLERVQDEEPYVARRPAEQPREDGPELDQEQRHRRRTADHVQPLRDPVGPHGPRRERDRLVGRLGVVADQSGQERDAEADAEPQPDPGRDRRTAQPGGEAVLVRRAHHAAFSRTANQRPSCSCWEVTTSPACIASGATSSTATHAQRKGVAGHAVADQVHPPGAHALAGRRQVGDDAAVVGDHGGHASQQQRPGCRRCRCCRRRAARSPTVPRRAAGRRCRGAAPGRRARGP